MYESNPQGHAFQHLPNCGIQPLNTNLLTLLEYTTEYTHINITDITEWKWKVRSEMLSERLIQLKALFMSVKFAVHYVYNNNCNYTLNNNACQ